MLKQNSTEQPLNSKDYLAVWFGAGVTLLPFKNELLSLITIFNICEKFIHSLI